MTAAEPPLPLRAWKALRERGWRYAWHKAARRSLDRWPGLKRRWVYDDPQSYWTLRGGADYFREQEDHPTRGIRSAWLAERVAMLQPTSVLEVGCGYGKQLAAIRAHLPGVPLTGVDFSQSQLEKAREYLAGKGEITLLAGSGEDLPFPDRSFDLVFTSAVILHNPPEVAEKIRREIVRVARYWVVHNEDTDVSYNRYGYDTAAWYRERGLPLAEVRPIPLPDPEEAAASQFCLAGPLVPATPLGR